MTSHLQTTASKKTIVLYDGHCRFCTVNVGKLLALARRGAIEALSFQEPGVLDRFPGLSYDECMRAMQLITPEGRVFSGFEAAVRAVATRPLLGWFAYLYYLPGLRQLCDLAYSWIARNRYRLMKKSVIAGACEEGSCSLHAHQE
jgi:predicted DCC family thiol-disulfide oxidoreductase YuxK